MELGGGIANCSFIQQMIEQYGEEFVQGHLAAMGDTVLSAMHSAHEEAGVQQGVVPETKIEANQTTEILPELAPTVAITAEKPVVRPAEAIGPAHEQIVAVKTAPEPKIQPEFLAANVLPTEERIETRTAMKLVVLETQELVVHDDVVNTDLAQEHALDLPGSISAETLAEAIPISAHIEPTSEVLAEVVPDVVSEMPLFATAEVTPGPVLVVPEETAPELTYTLSEILAEEPMVEIESAIFESGQEVPEAPSVSLLSKQLEVLVSEAVEPERQPQVAELVAQVYELVQAGEAALQTGLEAELTDAGASTEELYEAVAELLQELGIAEPTEGQVQRFIALVRAEVQATALVPVPDEPFEDVMHEILSGPVVSTSSWHVPQLHPRQFLGRLVLSQPIAA